jgi:polyisoprenoid-binding protein YceI
VDFPNDAVGATSAITGAIVIESGKVVPAESRIVVDLTGLKSDRDRRDGYLQRRTLETSQYPTVTLVPREFRGLPARLPGTGEFSFEVLADLTIRDVTRPTVWQVTATAAEGAFTGQAATTFTFEEFNLTQPRVAVVLSVENRIRLEYSFRLEQDPSAGR